MTQIGFVGLGHMGQPMAKNLLKAGFAVKVFDLSKTAMEALVPLGGIPCSSLSAVANESDVVITMLQTGKQVSEVCLSPQGLFSHMQKNSLYIDSSSIEVSVSRQLHEEAHAKGIAMVDAPVSGGVLGADAGTLTFMVGGEETEFLRAKPLFEKMGKKIVHVGAAGNGQAAKICNNLILGISMIAVSEGFTLGEKLGLDPKKLFEVSSTASGQCWSMTSYCPVPGLVEKAPSNNDYKAGFTANMMLKDLHLGEQAAKQIGAQIPMGLEAVALYTQFVQEGHGEMDFSGIIKMLM